jgi:uncharacterized protein YeeX (DUF496 family)
MTLTAFNQALAELQERNTKNAPASLVLELVEIHDLKERARISSEDCEIETNDNLSRIFELDNHYLIVAESSELDQYEITTDWDRALKIATDFCG